MPDVPAWFVKDSLRSISPYSWRSLQTRITLLVLCVFVLSIWSLYGLVSHRLQDDVERMLGDQQHATVALHASEINRGLSERLLTLEKVTQLFAPAMTGSRAELQLLMNERPALPSMFNGGFFVTDTTGTAIASVPLEAGRTGLNYMERDHIASALKDGKNKVSKPAVGKALQSPVVALAVPIRDAQDQIVGALVGVIDLAKPNFMDQIMSARYGKSGGYTLIAKEWRQVVTATNKARALQNLPPVGTNPEVDRYLKDFEGPGLLTDPLGVRVMASAASIASANWTLVASLPVEEAFAPVQNMVHNIALATFVVTLVAAGLTWWLLHLQLKPANAAFRSLRRQARSNLPLQALPQTGNDEIGQLIAAFNQLLATLSQREHDLRDSQQQVQVVAQRLLDAQEIAHLGSWTLDLVTGVLLWSDEIYRIFELDQQHFEPTYAAFVAAIHPQDRSAVDQAYTQSLVSRSPYQIEHRLRMPDGRIKWVQERCQSEFDASNRALRSVGTVQDITERKLTETALAHSRDLLMTVIDAIPMRVFWKDNQLNYLGCNTAFARDAGKQTPADLIGLDDYQMGWATQAELYRQDDRAVIDSGQARLSYDEPQTTPEGKTIWLRTSKTPLKDSQGEPLGVLGIYEDISEQKQVQEQIRKLSLIAEQSPESIIITNLSAEIDYVNETFVRNTGYTRAEVIGQNPRLLKSGLNPEHIYAVMWRTLSQGKIWSGELINRRKDGSIFVNRAVITPLRDGAGVVTHYVCVQEDLTDQKKVTDELEQQRQSLQARVALRNSELSRPRW